MNIDTLTSLVASRRGAAYVLPRRERIRKTHWIWAALAVLLWPSFPPAAHAKCIPYDSPISACTTPDGCPGERYCVGGYPTACIKEDPTCSRRPSTQDDFFIGLNAPTASVGILVDGRRNNAEMDDQAFVIAPAGAKASQALGDMGSSSQKNEVVSFAATRAPTRHLTPWTTGQDTFSPSMENTLRLPISLWILTAPGTYAAQAGQAASTAIQAGALFDQERVGIDFNNIDLHDETNNPNRGTFLNVTNLGALETQIGHVTGRFNVYWVQAVTGASGNGLGEVANGDSVAVGSNAAPGLLAHELGHNLALDHVDGDPRFDDTNVMWSAGGAKMFLTEGQAYRAHIRSISAIRSTQVYGLRPTMPIIDTCSLTSTTRDCPKADKRIWADGPTWPPN